MRSIEYMGYTVWQARNNHVSIFKNGHMVLHAQCTKRMSDKKLRSMVHNYLRRVIQLERRYDNE